MFLKTHMYAKEPHLFQDFWVVGINYKKSDANVRGTFAINTAQYDYLLEIAPDYGINEFFIISTCNRTEIYGLAHDVKQLLDLLDSLSQGDKTQFSTLSYKKKSLAAITHLYEVASGLDSQILGDYEILGQIKAAAKQAKTKGRTGAFTERLVNSVIQASKAVKTNTQLSSGTVSVSFAAIQYIKQLTGNTADKKMIIVGMGKIGKSTCKNLLKYTGAKDLTLINRTNETAESIAAELGTQYKPYESLVQEARSADILIVSTNSPEPILYKEDLLAAGDKIILDLSVPCNVDTAVGNLEGITLVNVDVLSKVKDETLEVRKQEVPKAKEIIQEHVSEFCQWMDMRRYVPVLKKVKSKLHEISLVTLPVNDSFFIAAKDKQEVTIQHVINVMASKIRRNNTPGCHFIDAINDYMGHHE